jgi:DNA-binding NtrC family response regulator
MTTHGNVLLIEDDSSARELFAYTLEVAGWTVRSAGDGLSGIRMLDVFDPDVVVLDMRLPAADGLSVLDTLGGRARTLPVIAISGYEDALETARAHPQVLALIRKPFTPEELVRTVARAKEYAPH